MTRILIATCLLVLVGCAAGPGPLLRPASDAGRDATSPADTGPQPNDAASTVAPIPLPPDTAPSPPVSGGSLLVLRDGAHAIAADSDTDHLYVIALDTMTSEIVPLPQAADPGRIVEDGAGRVHVVLRGAGSVATLAPDRRSVTTRDVCSSPRGIAWRETDDALLVACVTGTIVVLPAAGGEPTQTITVGADDLRDVVLVSGHTLVSRFRSAEVLSLDVSGAIVSRWRPATVESRDALAAPPADLVTFADATFSPTTAWRLVVSPDGSGAWLLHQRSRVTRVPPPGAGLSAGYYGSPGAGVGGLVETAVSFVDPTAPSGELHASAALPISLAVDVAIAPSARGIAIGSAASATSRSGLVGSLIAPIARTCARDDMRCTTTSQTVATFDVTSVAYAPDNVLFVLQHDPVRLTRWTIEGAATTLLDASVGPLGARLFQEVTPSGLACASCHPEAGDDSHVWTFGDGAPVRTQSVRGHFLATAPFHWEGDLPDFDAFIEEVFERRMSGGTMIAEERDALGTWLDGLDALPRPVGDAAAITRGQALFESTALGCSDCHAGSAHTDGSNQDVGTGGSFQVPTLTGIAFRAPYLHTGCAPTLRERFTGDASCTGGDAHGHTSHLRSEEIDDLVAYLRSL